MLSTLIIVLGAISLGSLIGLLLLVRWTIKLARDSAAQTAVTSTSASSAVSAAAANSMSEMTTVLSKSLGAMVALQKESTSGMLSVHQSQTRQIADLVTLLATKEPMAYSQVRQTQVALGETDDDGTPYPAVDDAAEAEARRKFIEETDDQREFLASMGVVVSDYGD